MRWRVAGVSFVTVVAVLLALAAPAVAEMRRGSLAYRQGAERPRVAYRVFWGVVDGTTVRTTKVMVRVTNRERPASKRNWVSVTVFVGGVHPGVGEGAWNGHAAWSTIAPSTKTAPAGDVRASKAEGAAVVWTTQMFLRSGVWKTRYVPADQRRSERLETWIRMRFHAPGRAQYWFRLTSPIG